jgi:hypothetical protein
VSKISPTDTDLERRRSDRKSQIRGDQKEHLKMRGSKLGRDEDLHLF